MVEIIADIEQGKELILQMAKNLFRSKYLKLKLLTLFHVIPQVNSPIKFFGQETERTSFQTVNR